MVPAGSQRTSRRGAGCSAQNADWGNTLPYEFLPAGAAKGTQVIMLLCPPDAQSAKFARTTCSPRMLYWLHVKQLVILKGTSESGTCRELVVCWLQEIEILKSLSFDRSIVQFYGTCPWQGKTMLVLEHMGVSSQHDKNNRDAPLSLKCSDLHLLQVAI